MLTGGASGIGLAIANKFSSHGLSVVIADVDEELLDAATCESSLVGVAIDVRNSKDWEALQSTVQAMFGRVDIVCNDAGVTSSGTVGITV